MSDRILSVQDNFLNSIRRSKAPVTIFLVKGVKLQGVITWFDSFSLLLRRDGGSQLVYKHAVSTIMPARRPAQLGSSDAGSAVGRGGLQDQFLAAAVREEQPTTLYLINGVMLQGVVVGFDQFALLLERQDQVQLVYKHAISTLQPAEPLNLVPEDSEDAGPE